MSTPSTPRTTRSASPTADSPAMLTPGRKIKAMLAAFDSDSESDNETSKPLKTSAELFANTKVNETAASMQRPQTTIVSAAEESSEDDDIAVPKGRMAARMQANTRTAGSGKQSPPASAFERVSQALHSTKEPDAESPREAASEKAISSASDDDGDLPMAGPRRRLASTKRTAGSDNEDASDGARTPARAFSPLFVSSPAAQQDDNEQDGSEEEDGPRPKGNARFLALVAQKRKEREEKEKLEAEKKAKRANQRDQLSSELQADSDEGSADDGASRRKLAKESRAPRKASKKAMEEMHRETQRMSRNMQLAHQAQAKKKITKESLFARFNFMQPQQQQPDSSSTAADSQQSSDAEANKDKETPQTSPVMGPLEKPAIEKPTTQEKPEENGTAFPTLEEMISSAQHKPSEVTVAHMVDRTRAPQPEPAARPKEKKASTARPIRVRLTRQQVAQNQQDDSDSDLEVVTSPSKCRRYAVFENHSMKRNQESQAMLKLKALAQLGSPGRKTGMTTEELSVKLLRQARQQALQERQERIAELKAKGMVIETAAERAAMEDELENLVEKARKEADDIAKQERKAAKNGQSDDDDDEEDEDYSGSEEEDLEEDLEDDENENEVEGQHGDANIIDSEAGEGDDSEDEQSDTMSTGEAETPTQRRKRPTRVISDDEDEEQEPKTPAKSITPSIRSVERPHIPVSSNSGTMSLTQAFAGTLANGSQSPMGSPAILHSLPDPVANMADGHEEPGSQFIVKDSQEPRADTADIVPAYAPSEARVSESPAPRSMSQYSQIPDPTQDEGFVLSPFDPSKRFLGTPTSTIETVLIDRNDSRNTTPVPEKRVKRLRRGREAELSIIEEQEEGGDFEIDASAFDVLKKAAKKPSVPFDRQKSKAKEVVEDAAEESDDEYAGLGGASDDEDDEENAYDRQMINDNSGEVVDEKQLAALNALHQRNADEKQVEKLLKDITTGALRRRKGAGDDLDLDDSDDELIARRREKQREFARMRRALLADEKIGEIAEDPKKAAFFRAIEDRDMDDDEDLDFLDYKEPTDSQETSSQEVGEVPQKNAVDDNNKRKRPLEPSAEDINNRPPPHMRRRPANAMSKKPATLAEIRQTLSFLTERPEYDSFHEDASVDEEEDQPDASEEDRSVTPVREASPARVHPRRTKGPVVDRLALLRQASSNSASSGGSHNRLAFHAGSRADSAASVGFRPPPMLRRMTGSSTSSASSKSSDSSRVSKPAAPMAKKGSVNYYTAAREKERERELRARHRSGGSNINALLNKHASNRLGALGGKGSWD